MVPFSTLAVYGLPIGLGLAVQWHLSASLGELRKIVQALPEGSLSKHKTGVKGVDKFLSAIIPFFRISTEDDAVRVHWLNIGSLAFAWSLWAGVEGLRHNATVLHYIYPFVGLFNQLLGVSVAVPAIWTPTFFRFFSTEAPVSTTGIILLFAGQIFALLPGFQVFLLPEPSRTNSISWFQISPALSWLTWAAAPLLGPGIDSLLESSLPFLPKIAPRVAAKGAFIIAAGFSLALHVQNLAELIGKRGLWKRALTYIAPQTGARAIGHFLAIDFIGLYAAILGVVYFDSGFEDVLKIVTLSPIVGPGAALSFHLATRESL
ncbi:hypothetical protein HK096_009067, partial [Nowakowskiella sp. JEL0078]